MSQKYRCLELQSKIGEIDARFEDEKRSNFFSDCSLLERHRARRHSCLCEIFRTGVVPRRPVETLRELVEIPEELLAMRLPHVDSPKELVEMADIPEELLFPRPRRGRPRNDSLRSQASALHCTKRHTRRLLASGKSRERDRESHPAEVVEALHARKERAALVCERDAEMVASRRAWGLAREGCAAEMVVSCLVSALASLRDEERAACPSPLAESRLVRELVKGHGLTIAALVVGATLEGEGVSFASRLLGVSPSAIYRQHGVRLKELRRLGQVVKELLNDPECDLARLATMKLPERERRVVDCDENVFEKQVEAFLKGKCAC